MIEEWRDIIGYEGLYQISNIGRIKTLSKFAGRSNRKEKIMKQSFNSKGYLHIVLSKNNISQTCRVNRLVALNFISNPDNLPQVNHKDGIKANNRVDNLEWCTSKYNVNHSIYTGLRKGLKGENNPMSKLTQVHIEEIRYLYSTGSYTQKVLAIYYRVKHNTISRILNNKTYK